MIDKLKSMWAGLPKWAKIGIPVAAVVLFIVGRMRASSSESVAVQNGSQFPQDAGQSAADAMAQYQKTAEAAIAAKFDAYTSKLEADIGTGLQTSLTAFRDDIMKQTTTNQQKVDGFGSLVTQLVGTVSTTHNELQSVVEHVDRLSKQSTNIPTPVPNESEVLAQARDISARWHTVSGLQQQELHDQATKLYSSIGATYDAAKGEWTKNGKVLN